MLDPKVLKHGFAVLTGIVMRLVRALCRWLRRMIALVLAIMGRAERRKTKRDRGCIRPPGDVLARPDPFIYSQFWLEQRGIAYTWDNPDFALVDPDSGLAVDSHRLQPSKRYRVEMTIHNGSLMAAIGTTVTLDVLTFGAGTPPVAAPGTVGLDVPAAGSAVAAVDWTTPPTPGHYCLRATVAHHDDANPQNNIGQHNTDVAVPASPERRVEFMIAARRDDEREDEVEVTVDGYELPAEPTCAATYEERRTHAHRERVQREHDPTRFPVAQVLAPRLVVGDRTHDFEAPRRPDDQRGAVTHVAARKPAAAARRAATRVAHRGGELAVALVVDPPPAGEGRKAVNVNVFDSGRLIGGVTAYVEEA